MSQQYSRKSPRAQRYDYQSAGMYFITICTQDRVHYFGEIGRDGISDRPKMILSDIGNICDNHIKSFARHRKKSDIHEYVVMPNHIHLLMYIDECGNYIDKRRDPISAGPHKNRPKYITDQKRTARDAVPTDTVNRDAVPTNKPKPIGPGYGSLGYIVNLLKGGITRQCKLKGLSFARQSRYHDHIVRTEQSYEAIKYYIQTNPDKRYEDTHYT